MSELRVIKIGGSLLELVDLKSRLIKWQLSESTWHNVYVVGGGRLVDQIRRLEQVHGLDNQVCHDLAMSTLNITAQFIGMLCNWPVVNGNDLTRQLGDSNPVVADVSQLEGTDYSSLKDIESSWDVTSDSIAAVLAMKLGASELVLLKSTMPPKFKSLEDLGKYGFVDKQFFRKAKEIQTVKAGYMNSNSFAISSLVEFGR